MGQILTNLPDDLKVRWQKYCAARKISMNKIMTELIIREINFPSDIAENKKHTTCRCLLCGTEWQSSKLNPVACPACKSYRWNDAAFQVKRVDRVTRQVERDAARNQHQLYKDSMAEYERVKRLTKTMDVYSVAELVGIQAETLSDCVRGIQEFTPDLLERMKRV